MDSLPRWDGLRTAYIRRPDAPPLTITTEIPLARILRPQSKRGRKKGSRTYDADRFARLLWEKFDECQARTLRPPTRGAVAAAIGMSTRSFMEQLAEHRAAGRPDPWRSNNVHFSALIPGVGRITFEVEDAGDGVRPKESFRVNRCCSADR
jgi:hypothetical protein